MATHDQHAVADRRAAKLSVAMWLNIGIVVAQVVFGFIAHSLGLIADAGHNLTDVAAVLASLVAVRWSQRPATALRSFGYHRATVIAAQGNAVSILVVIAVVTYEAIRRIAHPSPVRGGIVVIVALAAATINLTAMLVLRESHAHRRHNGHDGPHDDGPHHHDHDHDGHDRPVDLNMRSAALHMAGDTAASLGVAATGAVILATGGWFWLDPAVSIVVGLLVVYQAWRLLRQTVDVLLESTPSGLDTAALTDAITAVDGVEEVHDLHVWSLASDVLAMSAHLVLAGNPTLEAAQAIGRSAKVAVSAQFSIAHATFELESASCRDDGSWCALDH